MRKLFLDKDNKPWFVGDAVIGGQSAAEGDKQ
jgi:hypothetical protein